MMSENKRRVHQSQFTPESKTPTLSDTSGAALVEVRGLTRSYPAGAGAEFCALSDVSLTIARGKMVALVGASGSGKSTLLNLIAGLDRPTAGQISVAGQELVGRSEDELARHRGRSVGVVFQFFQLLPTLTTLENVLLPMELVGLVPKKERRPRALSLLARFGIADQANKLPTTLSGGQQQRVAIARALANDPPLLVADEPTGNLDSRTAEQVMALISELPKVGKTVIMATHETAYLKHFDRIVTLRDGKVVNEEVAPALERSSRGQGARSC
jgi:putative ABC transport system ATP-binding protein